jgi:Tol biopolymer transport system component
MDSDGGNQRMLYDWGMSPSWSPDGKRIAFWGQRDAWNAFKSADIYVMNSDGTNVKMLTVPGPEDDMYPDWSPDGKKIVFSSKRGGSYAIHVMDADGQNIQRLTNVSAYEFEPDWTAFSYAVTPAGKLKSLWGKIKTR